MRIGRIPERFTANVDEDGGSAAGPVSLRYEDVVQDGRVALTSLAHALGEVTWPPVMAAVDAPKATALGILPILARMVLEGGEGSISALRPLRGDGAWHRWAVRREDGSVERLVLSMWVDLFGRRGSTHLPTDPHAPELAVGRVYADHVFTRPFAAPGDRRVLALPSGIPTSTSTWRRFEDVGPPGDELPSANVGFGLMHTDPNQHVNSLVYPRMFEELAVRDDLAEGLARTCEIAWRKPFFVGERVTVRRWSPSAGTVCGAFVDASGAERTRLAMTFG